MRTLMLTSFSIITYDKKENSFGPTKPENTISFSPTGTVNLIEIVGSHFSEKSVIFTISLPEANPAGLTVGSPAILLRSKNGLIGSFVATYPGPDVPPQQDLTVEVINDEASMTHSVSFAVSKEKPKVGAPIVAPPPSDPPCPTGFTLNPSGFFPGELMMNSVGAVNAITITGSDFNSATIQCADDVGTTYSDYTPVSQSGTTIQAQFTATSAPSEEVRPDAHDEVMATETSLTVTVTNGDGKTGFWTNDVQIVVLPVVVFTPPPNPNP